MQEKWHINRTGLLNYWYFDNSYFHFANGKLLLRGANGSGKSVTTASLFPVLLDGNTNAHRLDPLGSSARRIEDYLLGEKEVSNIEDRTGYLFAEYKQSDKERYITTGIGIRARRGKSVDKWYFIILDNRRVGIDFELQHDLGKGEYRPYSQRELKNRLQEGGKVTEKRKEYATWVNDEIYRFENVELFQEMIQLMVEIRKPKLSKDFTPTVIYEILENSLPALKDDALLSVSEALENIEQSKNQLEIAKSDCERLNKIKQSYDHYHNLIINKLAYYTKQTFHHYFSDKRKAENLAKELQSLCLELESDEKKREETELELRVIQEELSRLQNHDVFSLEKDLIKIQEEIGKLKEKEDRLNQRQRNYFSKYEEEKQELFLCETELKKNEENKEFCIEELKETVKGSGFEDKNELFLSDYEREKESFSLSLWRKDLNAYQEELKEILFCIAQDEQLNNRAYEHEKTVSNLQQDIDKQNYELANWERMFVEDRDSLQSELIKWSKETAYPIEDETINEMTSILYGLYEQEQSFYDLQKLARLELDRYILEKNQEKLVFENRKELALKRKEELLAKIKEWENKPMPEPIRDDFKQREYSALKQQKERFACFYEVVDFKEEIPKEGRNRLEGALLDAGILDSFLSEKELDLKEASQLLPSGLSLEENLSKYLIPIENERVSKAYILQVLQGISVDFNQGIISVGTQGNYSLGSLKGKVTDKHESIYIGREAQLQYIKKQIELLKLELDEVTGEITGLNESLKEIDQKIEKERKLWEKFPKDEDLRVIDNNLKETKERLRLLKQEQEFYQREYHKIQEERTEIKAKFYDFYKEYQLKATREIITEAVSKIGKYSELLNEFHTILTEHKGLSSSYELKQKNVQMYKEYLTDTQSEADEVKGELNLGCRQEESLQHQLQLSGAEEIRTKIRQNSLRKESLEKEVLPFLNNRIEELRVEERTVLKQIEEVNDALCFLEKSKLLWEKLFLTEWCRYHAKEEIELEELLEQRSRLFDKSALNKENHFSNKIQEMIRENIQELSKYSPEISITTAIDCSELKETDVKQSFEAELDLLQGNSQRNVLTVVDEQGRRTDIYRIVEELTSFIEEQEQYIRQEDRNLFEHILLDSTGRIIKGLIDSAERWTKKMNQVLQRQNNYRGLNLFIEWKPRASDDERSEIGTKELVECLRKPAQTLTDETMEKMVQHFRNKIEKAKIDMEQEEGIRSLHDIMKEVLDYRKWFKFILHYVKDNQSKRELTNQVFNRFSGGEKAISMYLPLFTALYSRYEDASKKAPYLVVLDEAFAGVDERNISELFKAMEDLGFDYVLNSQSLWGDYATVKELMIYHLIREKGQDFVASRNYHWNGKERIEQDIEYT